MKNEHTSSTAPLLIGMAGRRCRTGCRRRHGHQHEPAPDAPHRPQDRQGCRARREPAGQDGGRLRGAQDGGLTAPASRRKAGTEGSPLPRPFVAAKKPADKSAGSWSEWRERRICQRGKFLFQLGYTPVVSDMNKIVKKAAASSFPTWTLAVWDMDTATLYMVKYDRSH